MTRQTSQPQSNPALARTRHDAQDHAERAVAALVDALDADDAHVALRAAETILALAFGRPGPMPEVEELLEQRPEDLPRAEQIAQLRAAADYLEAEQAEAEADR